jgi:hypothetical protein
MLQFLEAFERRSWRCATESPFLLPWSKDDLRHPAVASTRDGQR